MMSSAVRFAQGSRYKRSYSCAVLLVCVSSLGLSGGSALVTANGWNASPPALAISGVQAASPTTSSFQVDWSTNVAACSAVDYGTTANYGSSTAGNNPMISSHQVAASGLSPGTPSPFPGAA